MKETVKVLTFQEVKARLEKVQKAIEALQVQNKVETLQDKEYKAQLISLRESLENKLNILTEMDKGVIHTDDENKAKDLAADGAKVVLQKKGEKIEEVEEGLQFDENQTKEIAKEVAKAIAMALKEEGIEIASGKILRLEPMAFDTYFQYKDGKEDEFSFHIDQDKNIILSDFTFTETIGQVGLKGAGEPFVNRDVIKANLLKVWAKLDGNMKENEGEQEGDLMQQLEKALKSHDWYYMMSDDHRWYKRGSEQARDIHNMIQQLRAAGKGDEAEALYKSYHEKNKISEASAGSIQKKHGELVAKMKALAAQYKGGDQSVIPQLKAMTIEKKKLEAELDAKVAGIGADQELDPSVNEVKKDFDKDGKVEKPEEEYKGVKDKAIKKATGKKAPIKKEAVKAKKDFDKDGDVESPEAEYKGVKDKAVKKAMLKEDWGSSDQGIMNKSIHKDLGEPEEMPMPFDNDFESAVEDAVDFYWNEWEEYQSDRDGLIDHAKRAYYRRYFPEKFAGFQKMFSEAAVQSYADLETIANDTANMPADRDAARNKMYDLKKKSRGTKLAEAQDIKIGDTVAKKFASTDEDNVKEFSVKAIKNGKAEVEDLKSKKITTIALSDLYKVGKAVNEAPGYTPQDKVQELIEDMDSEEYENFAYDNDIDPNDANEMQNFISSLSDAEAEKILLQYGNKKFYIKVAVRDAKRALELIHDNPAYNKAVEIDGSDTYYLTNPGLAYDLQMDFGTQDIEVIDSNIDMNEATVNEGQFSWFTQDSNKQIGSEKQNKLPAVYMIDDKGKKYAESDYEGYGEFGGMDYYELLDVMNGGSGDRSHGIDLAFNEDPTHTEPVKFPALVTDPNFNWQAHDFTKEPKSDPNQGWYTGGEDDYYEDEDEYDEDAYTEGKHETELVQDPKSKNFTRRMKMTPKDMKTIEKVQNMMAKEKSLKKEGEGDETAVDITGKAYSIGDIIEFRGHKFECQIGQRGIVVLQKVDDELNPLPQFFEGGTPQFTAILKNAKIVSRGMGISEGGVNPEGDRMVLTFLKKLSKIWDIPMAHAVNFVNASIKRQGY
jgi:hypothetical protein